MRPRLPCSTLVLLLALPACSGGDFSVAATEHDGAVALRADTGEAVPAAESAAPETATPVDDAFGLAEAGDVAVAIDATSSDSTTSAEDSPTSSTPTLLSRGRPAKQSSTYLDGLGTYVSARGNDGDLANYQATTSEVKPWWRVDLGTSRAIVRVDIYNRKSRACPGPAECARVSKLDLEVSDDDVTYELKGQLPGVALYPTSVSIGATARYLRIHSQQTNFLDMGEVEVWGY